MSKRMLGVADIADMFGVDSKTVSMWRLRYKDFSEPDVTIGDLAGWDPAREEEIRDWESRRPGRGRRAVPAEHVQEMLRRTFVYKFMRPNDFAWAPIDIPGIQYKDGVLTGEMEGKATAHLVDAIRSQGYEIVFENPGADVIVAMHHVLWDKWSENEIGEHQFIGRLFDDRGQIYHGCTAFDAAKYTLQRLAALGGELRSIHEC
jgi:hypothetical protein